MPIDKILVPVDFSPCSDAALDYALAVADECGAEVEVLHVWSPIPTKEIFADTPEGVAMEQRLSEADYTHAARVSGRLEFGEEPSSVILGILDHERFDLVVMGSAGEGHCPDSGHVAVGVAQTTACKVVTWPPPEKA
jgi:nucleotide-binding universal stress UspA family protein